MLVVLVVISADLAFRGVSLFCFRLAGLLVVCVHLPLHVAAPPESLLQLRLMKSTCAHDCFCGQSSAWAV